MGNEPTQWAAYPLGQLDRIGDLFNAIFDGADRVAERILALQIAKLVGERQIMRGGEAEHGSTFGMTCINN